MYVHVYNIYMCVRMYDDYNDDDNDDDVWSSGCGDV